MKEFGFKPKISKRSHSLAHQRSIREGTASGVTVNSNFKSTRRNDTRRQQSSMERARSVNLKSYEIRTMSKYTEEAFQRTTLNDTSNVLNQTQMPGGDDDEVDDTPDVPDFDAGDIVLDSSHMGYASQDLSVAEQRQQIDKFSALYADAHHRNQRQA